MASLPLCNFSRAILDGCGGGKGGNVDCGLYTRDDLCSIYGYHKGECYGGMLSLLVSMCWVWFFGWNGNICLPMYRFIILCLRKIVDQVLCVG